MTFSEADAVGLSNVAYSDLPVKYAAGLFTPSNIIINNVKYEVIDVSPPNDVSYEGMILYDPLTKTVVVANRGTQEGTDALIDAGMAFTDVNLQWKFASELAKEAQKTAASLGASVIAVGHSLGGTLAQLQCAVYGFTGYTFNAYGAAQVFAPIAASLGLTSPNRSARIYNYRTMFDLVSAGSTQIGDPEKTIETQTDQKFVAFQSIFGTPALTRDLIPLIIQNHSLKNFWGSDSAVGKYDGKYTAAINYLPNPGSPAAQGLVNEEAQIVRIVANLVRATLSAGSGKPVQSGDLSYAQSAAFLVHELVGGNLGGIKAIMPSDPNLLANALNPSNDNDSYRYALANLSPVILQGIDISGLGNYGLWVPGSNTGLTSDYLLARNSMVSTELQFAYAGVPAGSSMDVPQDFTWIYSDLSKSSDPLFTQSGIAGATYNVMFADKKGDLLQANSTDSADELFGGAGNDTLYGGLGENTLQGGAGNDTYVINGSGHGSNAILDTDGKGQIEWSIHGIQNALIGGKQTGLASWASSDNLFLFSETSNADGTKDLRITSGQESATIRDFTNGELGITLSAATTPVPTLASSNLSALDRYAPGDTSIVFDNFYGDDGKHGTQVLANIYGSNTNGGIASYIDGFGNASFIYAGDGDNTVVGDNGNFDTVTQGYDNGANPNLYVLAGTGNQLIFGNSSGKETLQGGSAGALGEFETIFGSGADASISLGTEDGYVFGGTGADTLDAGNAQSYNVAGIDTVDAALIAGVTYDQNGDTISTESVLGGSPDTYQIYLNGSALLGSSLDPGVAGGTTLPGSLLIGGTGNDALVGNVGNDTLIGGTESVITPSTGSASVTIHDVLIGGAGSDLLIAGDGNDALYADMNPVVSNWADLDPTQSDTIYGGAGYDLVYGSGGSDVFYGGSGSFNVQVGNGASYVYAGSGATTVIGGSGGDFIEGGSGLGFLVGGKGSDTIFGGAGASSLYGWGGNDYINGGGGDDYLMADVGPADSTGWADAGSGDSVTIDGGGGNDTIFGSGGSNLIFAGSGNDAIELGNGSSTVDAGSGADTFYSGTGAETFGFADYGEQDAIVNPTSAASITLNMQGLSANDLTFSDDGSGDLVVGFGGSAVTLVGYVSSGESNVLLTFADGSSLGAGNIAKALTQPDGTVAWGSNGAPDTITANDGNDSIGNLSGYNVVFGGAGYDTIYGGTGSDTIEAGSGGASVIGGIGSETYVYNRGDGNLDIAEDTTSAGSDLLELGPSLSESDISFTRQGNNLVMLVDGGAAGRIGITNYFAAPSGPAHAVTSIAFVDGTSLDLAGVTAALVYNNAHITGTSGSNLYRFDDYSGSNTIDQASAASSNTIQFAAGIDSSLIVARRDDNNNLVLMDSLDGVSVTVGGYFNNSLGAIDSNFSISFADGSTWNTQQILAATMTPSSGNDELWGSDGSDTITGGPGNDTIIGVSGNNVLTGGSGSSTIQGGSGADTMTGGGGSNLLQGGTGAETYAFQLGNGSDTIVENGATTGTDTLQLGAGIQPSDVTFSHLAGSNDLLIRFGAATDSTVVVQGFLNGGGTGVHQLGSISFADGTSLTAAQVQAIAANVYASDNGIDAIQGGPGNNTIYGGSGSDTLIGGSGTNLIIGGSGTELIEGGSGYNTLIGGAGNDTIIAGPNGDSIDTGTGRALVETGSGNDTVNATGGVDTLQSSNGNDTYEFGIGSGQDTLQDYPYYPAKTGSDTLLIGVGLTASDLTFTRVGTPGSSNDALVVGVKGTKDSFTIGGYFSYQDLVKNSSPLSLQFQDGSSLSFGQVQTLANAQSDWNGAVSSLDPAPNSAQPANVLQGPEFARGDGAMVLDPGLNISADNVANGFGSNFYLAPGIRPQDVSLTADGNSVLLSIKGTSDSLYIPGLLDAGIDGYALTDINFYDGTVWDLPAVLQHVSYGTGSLSAAGQVINAATDADTLTAAGPNDTINAIAGDTVGFGYGDGQTVLNMAPDNSGGNSRPSTVVLGAGILPSDVGISLSDFGIALTLKDTGERLAVDGESWDAWNPSIGQVQFANGTVWDANNIQAMIDIGQPVEPTDNGESWDLSAVIQALPVGTNVLFGGVNGATLDLSASNALVVIDDGYYYQNDNASTTLNYGVGDGNVTVDDLHADQNFSSGSVSGLNTIQFGSGLTRSDIAVSGTFDFAQTSDSFASNGEGAGTLELTVTSTGKTITIPYWVFLDDSGQLSVSSSISNIAFQNGDVIDPAALILGGDPSITAMPGVVVGARGATTLTGAAGETIDAAIGNTVVLGSNQVITADASSPGSSTPPAESTYIFNTSTNGDTLSANVASTLEFAPGIDVSDVRAVNSDYGTTVYLRDTGAYVFLPNNGLTTTFSFADGQSFTPQESGTTFTGVFGAAFSPTTPLVTSDASGDLGYYAAGGNIDYARAAFVRGHVTNSVFGGSTWNVFDASATDIIKLPVSMQAGIDSSLLSQPVTFTFAPSATELFSNQEAIANYDANELIVGLPAGVTAQNLMVSESLGDITLSIAEPNGTDSRLTIDGFYSQVDGALQEKPLTIQFADGSSWNDQDVKQAIWQRSGGNTNSSQSMWIVSPSAQTIDLTNSSAGGYYQYVEIKNDGPNVLQLGLDKVNAARGSDTFIIGTNSNSQITNFDPSQDIIQFAAGIDPSDIEISQAYADAAHTTYSYSFSLRSTGAALLTVSGSGLSPSGSADPIVQFANGVSWSSSDMVGTQTIAPSNYYTGYNGYGSNDGVVISQAIRGTVGDESLSGGIGDDVIAAGVGNDTLNGGGGHDTLFGGVGNDTFVFGHGSGNDTIVASNDGVHVGTLAFTSDVTPADVSVVRPNAGNDLELILNDTGETVLLPNYLASNAAQAVQAVTFADGTSWTVEDLESMAHQGSQYSAYLVADALDESIAGGAGNDTIVGDENADTLAAGSGNDLIQSGDGDNTIIGGTGLDTIAGGWGSDLIVAGTGDTSILGGLGNETYRFGAAFGHDTLVADVSSGGTGSNVIRFEAGINASAVSFSLTGEGGLLISLDSNGDSILLPDHYVNGVPVADVDQIVFGDGSIVFMNQINQLLVASGGTPIHYVGGTVITGGDGNVEILSDNGNDVLVAGAGKDTLVGGSGTDILQAGTGNDQLIGGSGSETYLFGVGFGHDSLTMNAAGVSNTIQFEAGISAADVRYRIRGNDLVISVASSTAANGNPSTLTLSNYFTNGVPSAALNQVVFDDGTVVPMTQVNQALTSSSSLDGTVVRVLPGSGVVITAPAGDDTLTADTGNDTLIGGSGNDTYMFGPGFGQDRVIVNAASISNTIAFAAGITAADLTFKASGNSLVISVAGSIGADGQPSTLTLTNYFSAGVPVGRIDQVVYSDGTTVAMTQVNQALTGSSSLNGTAVKILPGGGVVMTAPGGAITLTGDNGSDTLIGGSGRDMLQAGSGSDDLQAGAGRETLIGGTGIDLFEAGTGNDLLVAGSGVETYLFATGFGHDTLASASDATSNTIQFAAGISAADVRYRIRGNDLVISVASSTAANGNPSTLTLSNYFTNGVPSAALNQVVFDDGTVVPMTQVNQALTSSSSLDGTVVRVLPGSGVVITAPAGDDTLTADTGNDTLIGGSGNDTYMFGPGFGQDRVIVNAASISNTIAFAAGITAADLTFKASGNSLVISVAGSVDASGKGSTLAIANYFSNGVPVANVGSIVFSDGSSLSMSQVNQQFAPATSASVNSAKSTMVLAPTLSTAAVADTFSMPSMLSQAGGSAGLKRQGATSLRSDGALAVSSKAGGAVKASPASSNGSQPGASPRPASTVATSPLPLASSDVASTSNGSRLSTQRGMPTLTAMPDASPGAPQDPMANDTDDPSQTSLGVEESIGGLNGGAAPAGLMSPDAAGFNASRAQRGVLGRTINASNDMVKALLASGGLQHPAMAASAAGAAAQVQLQGGTVWSLSKLDRTMAALTIGAASRAGGVGPHASFGSADLAHAQLISAMASFSPAASADTTLPPMASEAYAVSIAVHVH